MLSIKWYNRTFTAKTKSKSFRFSVCSFVFVCYLFSSFRAQRCRDDMLAAERSQSTDANTCLLTATTDDDDIHLILVYRENPWADQKCTWICVCLCEHKAEFVLATTCVSVSNSTIHNTFVVSSSAAAVLNCVAYKAHRHIALPSLTHTQSSCAMLHRHCHRHPHYI